MAGAARDKDNPTPPQLIFFPAIQVRQGSNVGSIMFTISSILFHWLQNRGTRRGKQDISHPFQDARFKTEFFPQSAQFLDFQWTPSGLSGQLRGVLSGLKPLDWKNLIHVDNKQFEHELMLKRALMEEGGIYR